MDLKSEQQNRIRESDYDRNRRDSIRQPLLLDDVRRSVAEFFGRHPDVVVRTEGQTIDEYGGDVVAIVKNSSSPTIVPIDAKHRKLEYGHDVFYELFHIVPRGGKKPESPEWIDKAAKKTLYALAEAFNSIPDAKQLTQNAFFAVNVLLQRSGEDFHVNPGWGLAAKNVTALLATKFPSGKLMVYDKRAVKKAVIDGFSDGLTSKTFKVLRPSLTVKNVAPSFKDDLLLAKRQTTTAHVTVNIAVPLDFFLDKAKVVTLDPSKTYDRIPTIDDLPPNIRGPVVRAIGRLCAKPSATRVVFSSRMAPAPPQKIDKNHERE